MKKTIFLKVLSTLLTLVTFLSFFTACGSSYTSQQSESSHEHEWENATCIQPKTCKTCGKQEGIAIDHDFGEWFETQPATCQAEGEKRRNCSVCGYYETRMIFVLEHTYEEGVCTVCGAKEEN